MIYFIYFFILTMIYTCNFSCICVDSDCTFQHILSYRERKIVRKLYDSLNPNKKEENMHLRKANCSFGQLCNNKDCNYKHRLSFQDRKELLNSYQNTSSNTPNAKKNGFISQKNTKNNLFNALEIEEPIKKNIIKNSTYFRWEDEADAPFRMTF